MVPIPHRQRPTGVWSTLGVIAFTAGLVFAVGGWVGWHRHDVLVHRGVTVTATVRSSSISGLRVEYRTPDGRARTARVSRPTGMAAGAQPETIDVRYDPQDPTVVEAADDDAITSFVFGVPGALAAVAGIVLLVLAWRANEATIRETSVVREPGGPAPPGWYTDPSGQPGWRWWSGGEWTSHRQYNRPPDPPKRPALVLLPLPAAGLAVGGFVLSYALAYGTARVFKVTGLPILVRLLASQSVLWAVLFVTCLYGSRRFGSGDWRRDFGWSYRWRDLWSGFGLFWLSTAAGLLIAAPLSANRRLRGSNTDIFETFRHDKAAYIVVAALGVVGAPIFEELFFRGLLFQGLASRMPVVVAAIVQGVLFGLAHTSPAQGTHNVSVVAAIAGMGLVLGLGRHYFRRLAPGMVGHGLHNLLVVLIIVARR